MASIGELFTRLRDRLGRDREAREQGERDAPSDPANAGSRATGGGPDIGTIDKNSTTGTTESGEFVGRAGSDETGDVEPSGGERRAGKPQDGRTGAARDE